MFLYATIAHLFVFLSIADCQLFHPLHSITYETTSNTNDYFGYSVFLQGGSPPKLVVGAPKGLENEVGSVHVCRIQDEKRGDCMSYGALEVDEVKEIRNRSMFGGSISGGVEEGDPVMVCAPKFTVSDGFNSPNYYTNGACYFLSQIEKNKRHILRNADCKNVISDKGVSKYNCGFSEFGFAADFDKKLNDFIVGTPGTLSFTGNALKVSKESNVLPPQARQISSPRLSHYNLQSIFRNEGSEETYTYRGYAVTTGRFARDGSASFVVGSPRGNDLKGQVDLVFADSYKIHQRLNGDTFGSYFGSSLCVLDVTGDGLEELLVGAPNYKLDKYDEGAVYFYKNNNGLLEMSKIITSETRNVGAHFGAAISKLPNVTKQNLDGVVISSPNEDSGRGAVYVYLYLDNTWKMHQKIQMENQMGFGYSLSKAIDVTNDQFNDIAVGSYKSNTAVLLKSRQIFHYDFEVNVTATLYSYKENPPFDVNFCVNVHGVPSVPTDVSFIVYHSRVNINRTYHETITKRFCSTQKITLSNSRLTTTSSLQVRITAKENEFCASCAISSPTRKNYVVYEIPFLVDCGEDQICTPDLKLTSSFDVDDPFVVGSKSPIKLKVDVQNFDEPAYLCKATLSMPKGVSLKTSSPSCEMSARNCSLPVIIEDKTSIAFDLNVDKFNENLKFMEFKTKLVCVNYTTESTFSLGLQYKSVIEAKGVNNKLVYKNKNVTKSLEYEQGFFIRNKGPSPLKNFPIVFQLPSKILSLGEEAKVFTIFKPTFSDNVNIRCDENLPVYTNLPEQNSTDHEVILPAGFSAPSKQGEFKCGTPNADLECLRIQCRVDLIKLQEVKVKFIVRPNLNKLLRVFKNTFGLLASLEYTLDDTKFIEYSETILEDTIIGKGVPWYWILLGVLLGLALLVVLVYVLYKYKFFKRETREQLHKEKTEREVQEMRLDVKDDDDEVME